MVGRFDGCIARYLGDGALAYFGYPRAHEDDAERSIRLHRQVGRPTPANGRLRDEDQLRGFQQGLKQAGFVEGENVSSSTGPYWTPLLPRCLGLSSLAIRIHMRRLT